MEREALYARLDTRIDRMIAEGLLDEVRALHARGYDWRLPSMSGLGYAQLGAYVRGETDWTTRSSRSNGTRGRLYAANIPGFAGMARCNGWNSPRPLLVCRMIETWLHNGETHLPPQED